MARQSVAALNAAMSVQVTTPVGQSWSAVGAHRARADDLSRLVEKLSGGAVDIEVAFPHEDGDTGLDALFLDATVGVGDSDSSRGGFVDPATGDTSRRRGPAARG